MMKYLINLFPEREKNATDKIIYFSFHFLRYILVITQFIAICVFFYRFKVDQDIVDLRDTLLQKQAIVESTQSLLDEVKTLDQKIGTVKSILSIQDKSRGQYSYLFGIIPFDIQIKKLTIEGLNTEIEGSSSEIGIVQSFYEQIKTSNKFQQVALTSVNRTSGGYEFRLSLAGYK